MATCLPALSCAGQRRDSLDGPRHLERRGFRRRPRFVAKMATCSADSADQFQLELPKSFKYKHKNFANKLATIISCELCDSMAVKRQQKKKKKEKKKLCADQRKHLILATCLLLLSQSLAPQQALAFCPNKCHCDDSLLSANCTQTLALTFVPMTLNPLLKSLTLNRLQLVELSNSLSVYRQLEYLNLNSNQLRQLSYGNFNFRPAPNHLLLPGAQSKQTLLDSSAAHNHSRAIRLALERSLGAFGAAQDSAAAASGFQGLDSAATSGSDKANELASSVVTGGGGQSEGFHLRLRELHLSDNKIEQLGEGATGGGGDENEENLAADESSAIELDETLVGLSKQEEKQQVVAKRRRLRAQELERVAPFLALTQLELLDLSANKLSRLEEHTFLGLIRLRQLDLSRNGLQFIHRHSLVGLIELRSLNLAQNKLLQQLQVQTSGWHLGHLGVAFCHGPLVELRHLDLSDNFQQSGGAEGGSDLISQERKRHILAKQTLKCTPKLQSCQLSNLGLRHIATSALDGLHNLSLLNLSSNPLEQVPDELGRARGLGATLLELDLSNTLIEFVSLKSSNSFNSLGALQVLHLNQMARLVSFDLAALAWLRGGGGGGALEQDGLELAGQQVAPSGDGAHLNSQLIELHLNQNKRHLVRKHWRKSNWMTSVLQAVNIHLLVSSQNVKLVMMY